MRKYKALMPTARPFQNATGSWIENTFEKTALMRVFMRQPLHCFTIDALGRLSGLSLQQTVDGLSALQREGLAVLTRHADEYYYEPNESRLHPDQIAARLQTRWWGKRIVYREVMSSTIDVAKARMDSDEAHGTVILTEAQYQGRGRQGSAWISPKGKDLLLTFLVRVQDWKPAPSLLSLYITTAVARVLDTAYGLPVQIKWPNDLIINHKKTGGVLAEIDRASHTFLLSLGLNVYSQAVDWPEALRSQSTSVAAALQSLGRAAHPSASHEAVLRDELLAQCGTTWDALWQQMQQDRGETVRSYWRRYSSTLRRSVRLRYQGQTRQGFAKDIDEYGRLLFIDESGRGLTLMSEEVQELRVLE